jgi:hypothetical protein
MDERRSGIIGDWRGRRFHMGDQMRTAFFTGILRPCYNLIGSGALPAHGVSKLRKNHFMREADRLKALLKPTWTSCMAQTRQELG